MAASRELEDRTGSPTLAYGLEDRMDFLQEGGLYEYDDENTHAKRRAYSHEQRLADLDHLQISLNKAKLNELEIGWELYNKAREDMADMADMADEDDPIVGDGVVDVTRTTVDTHSQGSN